MKVCKFGGSSLADAAGVAAACDIVRSDPARRVVVVSAPGRRHAGDIKVTDLLIACAEKRLAGEPVDAAVAAVVARYAEIQAALGLPDGLQREIAAHIAACVGADTSHRERYLDAVKAAGEDNCARLVAAELRRRGAEAEYRNPGEAGLLLSDEYGNARLLPESYDLLAGALGSAEGIVVFPGFFGSTRDGEVVTFPRGGSDITGSILAAALKAEVYENFTDVDSVCAVDPDVAPDVEPIPILTYREMRELSYAGFGVLHDEAILPAVYAGVPINIRNTRRPDEPGTMIVAEREVEHGRIVGIAASNGFCTIYVDKVLMNRELGFGRRFLQVFEDEGLSYEHMPSGVDNLSVVLRDRDLDEATADRVMTRLRDELGADHVVLERGLGLVMIAGEGMRYTVGLAARATRALAEAGVNIEMIDQGSSEISIMFGIKEAALRRAQRALYDAFFGA